MNKKVSIYATIKLELEVPDDMTEDQVVDEFFSETAYTFEETINIGILDTELLEVTTESPYADELEDMDDEFYFKSEADIDMVDVHIAEERDDIDNYTDKEFSELPDWKRQFLIRKAMS